MAQISLKTTGFEGEQRAKLKILFKGKGVSLPVFSSVIELHSPTGKEDKESEAIVQTTK